MKKIKTTYCRFALFGLLILAGISSCDVHEFPSVEEKTSVTLEFRFDTVLPCTKSSPCRLQKRPPLRLKIMTCATPLTFTALTNREISDGKPSPRL